MNLWDRFAETAEADIVAGVAAVFEDIARRQIPWTAVSPAQCPSGCGQCCVNFEPDITEAEALYTAAWLLQHKPEWADAVCSGTFARFRGITQPGCIFFNPESDKHCSVYDGRMEICRLFGFCGDTGKDSVPRWRPCRFLAAENLCAAVPPAEHRQYTGRELRDLYGAEPPAMEEFSRALLALTPDTAGARLLVRDALPPAIRRLKMIIRYKELSGNNPDDTPNPNGTGSGISA